MKFKSIALALLLLAPPVWGQETFTAAVPCGDLQATTVSRDGDSYTCSGSKGLANLLLDLKQSRETPIKDRYSLRAVKRPATLRTAKDCTALGDTWQRLSDSVEIGKSVCWDSSDQQHVAYAKYRKRRSKPLRITKRKPRYSLSPRYSFSCTTSTYSSGNSSTTTTTCY